MSNALEIREDPSEVKHYLTWSEALKESFSTMLGANIVSYLPIAVWEVPHVQIEHG